MKQNKFTCLSGYTDAFNVKRRTEDDVRQTHQESPCSLVDCGRQGEQVEKVVQCQACIRRRMLSPATLFGDGDE